MELYLHSFTRLHDVVFNMMISAGYQIRCFVRNKRKFLGRNGFSTLMYATGNENVRVDN